MVAGYKRLSRITGAISDTAPLGESKDLVINLYMQCSPTFGDYKVLDEEISSVFYLD